MFVWLPIRDGALAAVLCFTQTGDVTSKESTYLSWNSSKFSSVRWFLKVHHRCHPCESPDRDADTSQALLYGLCGCGQWSEDHTERRLRQVRVLGAIQNSDRAGGSDRCSVDNTPRGNLQRNTQTVGRFLGDAWTWRPLKDDREAQVPPVWFFPAGGFIYFFFPWFFFQSGFCRSGFLTDELELSVTPPVPHKTSSLESSVGVPLFSWMAAISGVFHNSAAWCMAPGGESALPSATGRQSEPPHHIQNLL